MLDEPALLNQVEECLQHPTRIGRCCIDTFKRPQLRVWFEDGTYEEIVAIRLKGGRVFLYCSQSYIYAMTGLDDITAKLINMTEIGPDWENANVQQDSTNDDTALRRNVEPEQDGPDRAATTEAKAGQAGMPCSEFVSH